MELEALQGIYTKIQDLGGSLVAISPQLVKYTKQVVKKHNLTFPVLADKDSAYAEKLGLNFTVPEKLQEVYTTFGIDLSRFNGNDSWVLPMSGRFIIDSKGTVINTEVSPDHTIRPEPAELLDILKTLR